MSLACRRWTTGLAVDMLTGRMQSVRVSPKFQVVIPRAVREQRRIEPGQKLQVLAFDLRIEFLPIECPRSLRGFLSVLDTDVPREGDRE